MFDEDEAYLRAVYHFRKRNESGWTEIPDLEQVEASVWEALGTTAEYQRDDILQNDDLLYFPLIWIGCGGALVHRDDGSVETLGSAARVSTHVWAHYRGFAGAKHDTRLNDLVIVQVADQKRLEDVLRGFLTRKYVVNVVRPALQRLPLRVRDINLYFAREDLRRSEEEGWFEFSVH